MKFRVAFKTPDAVEYALSGLVMSHPERDKQDLKEEVHETVDRFVEYGEMIVVEFDTETKTATVLPVRR